MKGRTSPADPTIRVDQPTLVRLISPRDRQIDPAPQTHHARRSIDLWGNLVYWWERWPGRLEHELRGLEQAGIRYERDAKAFEDGVVRIRLWSNHGGREVELVATFPDLYPWFRFEVAAPQLSLVRHQHPFGKNLCLIGRASANWHTTDTLVDFVTNRLSNVIAAADASETDREAELEEHQGEPFSDFYQYSPGNMILVDSAWRLDPSATRGTLTFALQHSTEGFFRGVVLDSKDQDGHILEAADEIIRKRFQGQARLPQGKWVRLKEPQKVNNTEALLRIASTIDGNVTKVNERARTGSDGLVDVIAIIFPEETRYNEHRDGWVFLVRRGKSQREAETRRPLLVKAGRAGPSDMRERISECLPLQSKKISMAGLGCLGAPSAIEFAKNGLGQLCVLDCDLVDPGTICRWPLGFSATGLPKSGVLKYFIEKNWPYTRVETLDHRIGVPRDPMQKRASDWEVIDQFTADADLIFDATAEIGVQQTLSALARERGIPYVCVSTTPGAWGGVVARVLPKLDKGCWMCLQHMLDNGTISPPPFDEETGDLQPTGCADPTFSGASFDTGEIVLAGVRMAVATLCGRAENAYPDCPWDIGILSLRKSKRVSLLPSWDVYDLERQQECRLCSGRM